MTGKELLKNLIADKVACNQEKIVSWYTGRSNGVYSISGLGGNELAGALYPLTENTFWAAFQNEPYAPLIEVFPHNGERRTCAWHEFVAHLSSRFDLPLNNTVFLETLRLFAWLQHAQYFAEFQVTTSSAMPKATPKKKEARPKAETQLESGPVFSKSKAFKSEDRSLDIYLREIAETPLIEKEEEIRLAMRIQEGDEVALQQLTKANLRFVVSVAKQYQNQGISLADLINEGNIGLIKAAKRFDWSRGFKFISYAVWWIRQAILQALAEQSRIVRLPVNRVGTMHKIRKASSLLSHDFGREPSAEEIAEALELSEIDVALTMQIADTHLSLDAPFSETEDNSLLDILEDTSGPAPDTELMDSTMRLEIAKALETLTPREAEVINLYFGLDRDKALTLEEIGTRFNLTRERIRQVKEKAIRRLRHASRSRTLRAYLR